jgi:predicted MFS family arabinose efflux permease
MTSANEAATGTSRGVARFVAPYAEIFRVPHAWRFSVAGIIGRMPMSMVGLGIVLLISASTGRYGVAGSVGGGGGVGAAGCGPQMARLADRHGQGKVLAPLAAGFALSVVGLIVAVELDAPSWAFFPPGIAAGAAMPALGPMARARWSSLLAGSPRLHAAFSLESVADEVCFVVGPATVTILSTQVDPAAGITAAVALCLAGTLWFAAQRDTEPSAVRPAPSSAPERDRLAAGSRSRLAAPGLAVMVPVYLFIGGMFVSIDLSTVAFAAHFGHKALSGLILGVYAAGSGTGGLWYGSRTWRAPASRRLAVTLTMTVAGEATFWAMPNLAALTVVIFLCGMTIAPTLIAGFSLLESTALPGRVTEAMSWLSTGIAIGVAAGSTAVGFILDAAGPRWGYVFAASCGFVAVIVYLSGLALSRSLRTA